MIVLRRSLAVFFIAVFPLVLLLTLVLLRVNATVLEPRFYASTLERVDAYNFLYDEALPTAIRESGVDLDNDIPLGLDLTPAGVSAYAKRVLPPEWLEQNVSTVLEQVVPYATGRTDFFQVRVRLDDRVEAAAGVVDEMVLDAQLHAFLIDEVVRPELTRNAALLEDLPLGLQLTPDQVVDGVVRVVPEDWLKAQAVDALDRVVPYVISETDGFSVVIPLQERADVAFVVLEDWLLASLDGGAYRYLLETLVAPMVGDILAAEADLPYGVVITEAQVLAAVERAVPEAWVEEQVRAAITEMGNYLTGRTEGFVVVVPLDEVGRAVAQEVVATIDAEVENAYNNARPCTLEEVTQMIFSPGALPDCRIEGVSYEEAKTFAGYDTADAVDGLVRAMPPTLSMGRETLLGGLPAADIEALRSVLRDGYVFSHADLRNLLVEQGGPELLSTFEDMRASMRDGFVFTEADFRELAGASAVQVDEVRGTIGTARSFAWLLLLPPLLIVAIVGFLGGQTWWTRLAWAGVPFVLGGLVVATASGFVAGPLRELTGPMLQNIDAPPAIVAKVIEVRDELVRAFLLPIMVQAMVLAVAGVAAIVGGIVMTRRERRLGDYFDPAPLPVRVPEAVGSR